MIVDENPNGHPHPEFDLRTEAYGKCVSPDVFAIWRGIQEWIVETGLLSPLNLSLRLMPSRKLHRPI
jgi:hypothetical protein